MKLALSAIVVLAAVAVSAAPAKPPARGIKRAPIVGPMAFSPNELDLAPGETYPVELYVPSPTGRAFNGVLSFSASQGVTVAPDPGWNGKVPGWGVKTHPKVIAAGDATGDLAITAALKKGGRARLVVKIARPGVEAIPGDQKLTVRVTNPFRVRLLHGRVVASNPDRFLQDVTTLEFNIAPGATQELVFPLPGASPAEGEKYDFTLNVETYQGYRDRTTHSLAFPSSDSLNPQPSTLNQLAPDSADGTR